MAARITHKQLEAFHAVVDLGSVKEAALFMSVTQPAISHLLKTLEESVGFKVFERTGRTLELTVEGRRFFEEAQISLKAVTDIQQKAEAIRLGKSGHIRFAASPAYVDGQIATTIGAYINQNKGVFVEVESLGMAKTLEMVATGQFDIGVIAKPMQHPLVQFHSWKKAKVVCVVPKGHPLSIREVITPSCLQDEDFVQTGMGSPFRYKITEYFQEHKVKPQIVAEVRTQRIALRLVEQGVGLALLDEEIAREGGDKLVSVIPIEPSIYWEFCFVTARYRKTSQVVEQLLKYFME